MGSRSVSLRVSEDVFQLLETLARREGATISELLRSMVRECLCEWRVVPCPWPRPRRAAAARRVTVG